jgi:hypothetical protein
MKSTIDKERHQNKDLDLSIMVVICNLVSNDMQREKQCKLLLFGNPPILEN